MVYGHISTEMHWICREGLPERCGEGHTFHSVSVSDDTFGWCCWTWRVSSVSTDKCQHTARHQSLSIFAAAEGEAVMLPYSSGATWAWMSVASDNRLAVKAFWVKPVYLNLFATCKYVWINRLFQLFGSVGVLNSRLVLHPMSFPGCFTLELLSERSGDVFFLS